jgi:hypothetical protein
MADKQIIPIGMDLNQPPPVDDSLAIVPILEPTPLTVIPPKSRQWSTDSPTMPKFAGQRFLRRRSVYF